MSRSEGYERLSQSWMISSDYDDVLNEIDVGYDKNMYISSLTYGEGYFVLVMTEGDTGQIFRMRQKYSDIRKIMHEWWDKRYYITSITYSGGIGWILVMTKVDEDAKEIVRVRPYFRRNSSSTMGDLDIALLTSRMTVRIGWSC